MDHELNELIYFIESVKSAVLPVTLIVDGTVVTGHLTSFKKYTDQVNAGMREFIRSAGVDIPDDKEFFPISTDDEEIPHDYEFQFLQIINGRIISPSGTLGATPDGFAFRIRTAAVSGWMLGEWGAPNPESKR